MRTGPRVSVQLHPDRLLATGRLAAPSLQGGPDGTTLLGLTASEPHPRRAGAVASGPEQAEATLDREDPQQAPQALPERERRPPHEQPARAVLGRVHEMG